MINFMSSWAEQIVLAVIVATIIELILPKSKNRKYIQMVIGIYVLFNIISPIIKNKEVFSVVKYDIENYTSQSKYEIDQTSMDERLEKIYLEELEDIVIEKFEENNFEVVKCKVDAVLNTNKKNAGIHSITVKLRNATDTEKIEQVKEEIANELEIDKEKIKT